MALERTASPGMRVFGIPRWVLAVAVLVAVVIAGAFSVTPLSRSEASKSGTHSDFSAASFAAKAFPAVVVPYVKSHAQDLATLASELNSDSPATRRKYGHDSGIGSQFAFPITTVATAADVTNGLLTLQVPGIPAGDTVYLQVGPAITGSALRDVSGKYPFSAFADQIDYLNASLALNDQAKSQVLAKFDPASLKGKSLRISGAFLESINPGFISIVPTAIEVES